MDLLKGIMSGIGMTPARVKLIPEQQEFRQGEDMKGKLVVYSGSSDVAVDMIYLQLKIDAYQEREHIVRVVKSVKIAESFIIEADAPPTEHSFSFRLPYFIPVSTDRIKYTCYVGLDVKNALDPHDAVPVRILPSLEMEAILGALERLGFLHRPESGAMVRDHQQFAFYPTGFMRDRFNELEILFNQNKINLYLYLEIDRRARGISWLFTKALYLDENHHRFTIPSAELVTAGHPDWERATELLIPFIEQVYRKK